jgi:hypothetical protein
MLMKQPTYRTFLIVLFTLGTGMWCYASNEIPRERALVEPYLATTEHATVDLTRWENFLNRLATKREQFKDDSQFLEFAFYRTHQLFLKRYAETGSFADVFTRGTYNCLSGTILYAIILNHFGIPHDVIETNYHIFIIAHTSKGDVLLEATNGLNGFIQEKENIDAHIARYQNDTPDNSSRVESYYDFSFSTYNTVTEEELIGLLYFNYAVEAYNKKDLQRAALQLEKATGYYTSARIEEFASVMLTALGTISIKEEEKVNLTNRLQQIRYKAMPTMVSAKN